MAADTYTVLVVTIGQDDHLALTKFVVVDGATNVFKRVTNINQGTRVSFDEATRNPILSRCALVASQVLQKIKDTTHCI